MCGISSCVTLSSDHESEITSVISTLLDHCCLVSQSVLDLHMLGQFFNIVTKFVDHKNLKNLTIGGTAQHKGVFLVKRLAKGSLS